MLAPDQNAAEKRRFPRLRREQPGTLDVKDAYGEPFNIPVIVESISPEGVGVRFETSIDLPKNGTVVTAHFHVGQRDFDLPGRIAWAKQSADGWHVGIKLMLELARSSMRQAYARWIVDQIGRDLAAAQSRADAPPRSHRSARPRSRRKPF